MSHFRTLVLLATTAFTFQLASSAFAGSPPIANLNPAAKKCAVSHKIFRNAHELDYYMISIDMGDEIGWQTVSAKKSLDDVRAEIGQLVESGVCQPLAE